MSDELELGWSSSAWSGSPTRTKAKPGEEDADSFDAPAAVSAALVSFYGYDDCAELRSPHATAVITRHGGGRVLKYSLVGADGKSDGRNAIHLDDGESGCWEDGSLRGGSSAPKDGAGGEQLQQPQGWTWEAGQVCYIRIAATVVYIRIHAPAVYIRGRTRATSSGRPAAASISGPNSKRTAMVQHCCSC